MLTPEIAPASSVRGAACALTRGERVTRGVLAALVGGVAYAAATSGRLWCAVPDARGVVRLATHPRGGGSQT